jgi:hypothetical protein
MHGINPKIQNVIVIVEGRLNLSPTNPVVTKALQLPPFWRTIEIQHYKRRRLFAEQAGVLR